MPITEIWKPIKNYENYSISSLRKVRNSVGDILSVSFNKNGVKFIRLSNYNRPRSLGLEKLYRAHFKTNSPLVDQPLKFSESNFYHNVHMVKKFNYTTDEITAILERKKENPKNN